VRDADECGSLRVSLRSEVVKTAHIVILGALLGGSAWLALDWAIERSVAPAGRGVAIAPVLRFVNVGTDEHGTGRPSATVWLTSTALEDCAQVIDARKRDEKRRLNDLVRSEADSRLDQEDRDACAPFRLGEAAHGTQVEVLGECGLLVRIRILTGSLQGREGCIEKSRLGDAAVPAPGRP
jgi:hypothetical protein